MGLAKLRIIKNEHTKNDPDEVPKQAPIIILYGKSSVCMSRNDKDTKHTKPIDRIMQLLRNGEE